ncbi:hypothetical protein XO10_09255 [Marinitoga sp. 1135]|uniref:hypothetical protein n=1 Tax=unclassified Marinitoga TaxID=2640159 RepID=UPI001586C8E7|nr:MULTISPECIES: hypothetical protein [unclassified Marinitoga]NUU96433.1 hypothetical protein [Marinitoga sp. 1135]NUU98354.1 hypothetical protein [Marinitoga sp. 1138]
MAKKEKKKKEEKEEKKEGKKKKIDFSKITGIIKKINIKQLIADIKNFKQLPKKKKITLLGGFLVFIIFIISLILIPTFRTKKLQVEDEAKSASVSNLFLYVPPGAFQYRKTFTIKALKENSAEYQNLKTFGNFYGPIYEIIPDDNKEESSLKPIKIKYRIPLDLYYGDNFNNFAIMYASNDDPPIIKKLPGCEIFKDESLGQYIVQANVFHFSKFGLYVDSNPKEVSYGIKTLIEKPPSLEPDLLLVPGVDNDFLGYIPNTQTINNLYGENVWSLYFPNRTIWYYKYPILESKPKNYMDSYFGFYIRTGSNSFLEFEAERFAAELKAKQNKQFDIIAQGIGALIVRYALETHPEIKNVRTLTLFSPPNKGMNIVNPIYYNIIYKKNPEVMELSYGINKEDYNSLFLNISSKIEMYASYYKDLLPDSKFIRKLNNMKTRKDIDYYVIMGTKPDLNAYLKNSKLKDFYPELIDGIGDGLVTLKSAELKNARMFTFDLSYDKLYSDNNVLKTVQKLLSKDIKTVKIPQIKDDDFVESQKELEEKKKEMELKTEKESLANIFVKSSSYMKLHMIDLEEQLLYISKLTYGKIYMLGDNAFVVSDNGVYDLDGRNILNKKILGSIEYKKRLYVTTMDGVYAIDASSNEFMKIKNIDFEVHNNVYYLPEIRKYIYVDYQDGLAKVYENNELISEKTPFDSIKVINNDFYIILGNKVLKRKEDKWVTVVTRAGIEDLTRKPIGNIIDYYSRSYYIFLLTSDYRLVVYDTKNSKVQFVGDGDVGKMKLLENNNRLWIFDRNFATYIDLKNKVFPGVYDSITDFEIIDIIGIEKDTFLLLIKKDGGFELWKAKVKF